MINNTQTQYTNQSNIESKTFNNNLLTNNVKQIHSSKERFLESNVVFPNEEIISRGLEIIEQNPCVGATKKDIREQQKVTCKKVTTTFNHSLPLFVPTDLFMGAIADYYKKKHGIYIYIVNLLIEDALYMLIQQLDNKQQIGVIVRCIPELAHVTSIIITKKDNDIFILRFDSTSDSCDADNALTNLNIHLNNEYNNSYIINVGQQPFQADYQSCRIGSLLILKDALIHPDLITQLQPLKEEEDCTYINGEYIKCKRYSTPLPKFLFKTVQSKNLLNTLTMEDLQAPIKTSLDNSKKQDKTLQTHLNKYNRNITAKITETTSTDPKIIKTCEKQWQVNTYLQTKAYSLVIKAFNILKNENTKVSDIIEKKILNQYVNPHLTFKE